MIYKKEELPFNFIVELAERKSSKKLSCLILLCKDFHELTWRYIVVSLQQLVLLIPMEWPDEGKGMLCRYNSNCRVLHIHMSWLSIELFTNFACLFHVCYAAWTSLCDEIAFVLSSDLTWIFVLSRDFWTKRHFSWYLKFSSEWPRKLRSTSCDAT